MPVGVGVLASGGGSNLAAIIEAGIPVHVVIVDRPCGAVEVAARSGVEVEMVERESFGSDFDRFAYTQRVVEVLGSYGVGLAVMAGFGTILESPMYEAFPSRVLNTHPALLPDFKGWHAVRDALAAKVKVTGCTVHIATIEVDDGPILAQEVVPILRHDTEETLHERIKIVERRLYPATIQTYIAYLEWLDSQWSSDSGGLQDSTKPRWVGAMTAREDALSGQHAETRPSGSRTAESRPSGQRRRALLSVYDKIGVVDLARGLAGLGYEIVSSGGTSAALREAGVAHRTVEEVTGAPEMLGGRVKTLHPLIHGGILADRSKPEHMADLDRQGIDPIDIVVCNLYPFRSDPSVELIDVGGPTMVRAAAKNHDHVGIVVDPDDYKGVLDELRSAGALSVATRLRLARKAFSHTAAYDAAIVAWLDRRGEQGVATASGSGGAEIALPAVGEVVASFPPTIHLTLERAQELRYGENPHQVGARYRNKELPTWWDSVVQRSGMELSYLNLFDTEAAWRLVHEVGETVGPQESATEDGGQFTGPGPGEGTFAVVIVKHANPCGVAVAGSLADAYRLAFDCDPVSAFGGIVALNAPVTEAVAEVMVAAAQADVVVAPGYEETALAKLIAKRKNTRILQAEAPSRLSIDLRRLDTGFLVQVPDTVTVARRTWKVATKVQPTQEQWSDAQLAWLVCARTTSNAIVIVHGGQAVGIGAGQQNRLESARIAVSKAGDHVKGAAAASDAFFPFRDGLDALAEAGAGVVVQPGGSVRDEEVIAAADEHGIAMVLTGERHFRH